MKARKPRLSPKYPLFFGRTVRESRRNEAVYYKDYPREEGSRRFVRMSERRIKKFWVKSANGGKPAGREERKLYNFFSIEECRRIDHEMLRNAY